MKSRRSTSKSQLFAAGITFAASAIMLAPLRSGPQGMHTQNAAIIPLLAAGGVAETAAFHRLDTLRPLNASLAPQVRAPSRARPTAPATANEAPLQHDFDAPRTRWEHLDSRLREQLDAAIASGQAWTAVELHGCPAADSPRQMKRSNRLLRGSAEAQPYDVVLGREVMLGSLTRAGTLHVCFAGDFQTSPPQEAQMAALDELLDYLAVKSGTVQVQAHPGAAHSCLGAAFPLKALLKAVAVRN